MAQYSSIEHMVKDLVENSNPDKPVITMPVYLRREPVGHDRLDKETFIYTKTNSQAQHCKDRLPVLLHYYTVAFFSTSYTNCHKRIDITIAAMDNATHEIIDENSNLVATVDILYQQDKDEVFELFDPPIFCREIEIEIREAKNNLINA